MKDAANNIRDLSRADSRDDFHDSGLYFPNEVNHIIDDILGDASGKKQSVSD